jgi:hypothetical protein
MRAIRVAALCGIAACKTAPSSEAKAEVADSGSEALIPFASADGIARLDASDARVDFFPLANHFEGQSNGLYCGPTSVAIVVNALRSSSRLDRLPRDKSRMTAADLAFLPASFDPTVPRFTQEAIFDKSPKSRALVFGKPTQVGGKVINDFGYQLRQLNDAMTAIGLRTKLRIADTSLDDQTILSELKDNLHRPDDYVVVNYDRAHVGQTGGGHISPVAAYDVASDSFLILDVNPSKATWVWMPANVLIRGMRTLDTVENRGYILVSDGP